MKQSVKYFKRVKKGKTYYYPWLGHYYRNKNGHSQFKREFCLAHLPEAQVQAIKRILQSGEDPSQSLGEVTFLDSVSVGAEWATFRIAEQLGIVDELQRLEDKHRDAILCMILDRVINRKPYSKSALYSSLPASGIERVVCPQGVEFKQHDMYIALEKLYQCQNAIERGLYSRREQAKRMFLYDITSSYVEGEHCPLAAFGYNRDGKRGKMQIVLGLLTDDEGLPVAVEVFEGNTSDETTVMGQVEKMRHDFGLEEIVFIGDRGMLTSARRKDLHTEDYEKINYITALNRDEIFKYTADRQHPLQMSLFDRHNLVEVEHEGVRYILCHNPEKEQEDKFARRRLIEKTEQKLESIRRNVEAGRIKNYDVIAKRVYRWINYWGMERFFSYNFEQGHFEYQRNEEELHRYDALNGCYVIISDTTSEELSAEQVRSRYKSLSLVEQAFRSMKSTELYIRPLRHWNPERVKGHVFMCMLAYMAIWKARKVFQPWLTAAQQDDTEVSEGSDTALCAVWQRLQNVKIGKMKIGERIREQLKPLDNDLKSILKAGAASMTQKALTRIGFVG